MPVTALAARDVCVQFGQQTVLDHVTFTVEEGDFVGVVGPNGGGKSTLLRAMLGLVPTTCGDVHVYGAAPTARRALNRVAYVPQHVVHVDQRFPATAFEIARLGRARRRGLFRRLTDADHEKTMESMDEVGVAHLSDRLIGTLSGGQRQRVFLAQAIAADPDVLILDEPTTGVDPKAREAFYRLLDHLNHDHAMTLVLVSHDTQAIALTAHRLVALNRTVVFDGPPADFEDQGGFAAAYDVHLHHEGTPH